MADSLWSRIEAGELEIVRAFIRSGPPVKVGELASALGLRVTRTPNLPSNVSGLIRPAETESGFEVLVNKYESQARQRFTVAHEIAHYLLHRNDIGSGVIDSIMYRSSLSSRKEVEANRLAAAIVMPASAVSERLQGLGGLDEPGVVEELAEVFKVSEPAMRIRLGVG
ncbi:MAG: ImmA/IrrE family metallo-endopeptidase [Hyphomonadaceae bacterium]|nr:ImmA/IrrE family metallo-endopeptidase [Hyphomonadaceae bacterium]